LKATGSGAFLAVKTKLIIGSNLCPLFSYYVC
jgi:hypothetical protein